MKAGDLVRHNGNHSLWLLLEVEIEEYSESFLVVAVKTGYKMWADRRAFKLMSKCQENVKSDSDTLHPASSHVIL